MSLKIFFLKESSIIGEFIHFYIKETDKSYNKLGIAVSKKEGKAVERNRIKRIIRENYKNFEDKIKLGTNILIVINKEKKVGEISFKDIEGNFYRTLKKADVLVDEL